MEPFSNLHTEPRYARVKKIDWNEVELRLRYIRIDDNNTELFSLLAQ